MARRLEVDSVPVQGVHSFQKFLAWLTFEYADDDCYIWIDLLQVRVLAKHLVCDFKYYRCYSLLMLYISQIIFIPRECQPAPHSDGQFPAPNPPP